MVTTRYTHVTIFADDLAESVRFYETVFEMERIPTPEFSAPIQWLRCGDHQLHLVETDVEAPPFHHFGVSVDDFEAVYRAIDAHETASFEALDATDAGFADGAPPVYRLPTGTVQLYARDPAGNLLEVDYPDADAVDRSAVPNVVERDDVTPPDPGAGRPAADIFGKFGVDPTATDD